MWGLSQIKEMNSLDENQRAMEWNRSISTLPYSEATIRDEAPELSEAQIAWSQEGVDADRDRRRSEFAKAQGEHPLPSPRTGEVVLQYIGGVKDWANQPPIRLNEDVAEQLIATGNWRQIPRLDLSKAIAGICGDDKGLRNLSAAADEGRLNVESGHGTDWYETTAERLRAEPLDAALIFDATRLFGRLNEEAERLMKAATWLQGAIREYQKAPLAEREGFYEVLVNRFNESNVGSVSVIRSAISEQPK